MPKLIFEDSNEEVELPENSEIAEACEEQGIPFACTEGICGTCVIQVKGNKNLSKFTDAEKDFLGEEEENEEDEVERLACQCKIKTGTVTIKY